MIRFGCLLLLVACATKKKAQPDAPPAAYVGSSVCRDCHEQKYQRWKNDWHARALTEARKKNVVGNFHDAHYVGTSNEAWMTEHDGSYVMRTADQTGQVHDYDVQWLIGGKRMQDAVTVFPDGRWQVLPVYYHVTGHGEWVDYNEVKQGVVGHDHPFFWTNFRRTANHECLDCHATGLDVRVDHDQWSTDFSDPGVACEACHGPGARHAETKAKADIVFPKDLAPNLQVAICARCHGPREPLFPFLDQRHRFVAGRRYEDYFQPAGLVDGAQRSGEFFADGRPSSSSFEWQGLLQSKCYMQGGATCLTCHTAPHQDHEADSLKPGGPDASCTGCHQAIAAKAAEHSHHAAVGCTSCHMAKTLSGVLDKLADHSIDVPVPENTELHGVPNACGTCHEKVDTARMKAWWPKSERRLRRMRLADAFDEKTKERSLPALREVARDTKEAPLLRGFAVELMAQRFAAVAAKELPALVAEKDSLLRSSVIRALGTASAKDAKDVIAGALTDPSLFVQQNAAIVLATWGDARGVLALEALVKGDDTRALVRPHIMLSQYYAQHQRYADAKTQIDEAIARMPYLAPAWVFAADIAVKLGDIAAAKADLLEALHYDPQHKGALARLHSLDH